MIREIPDPMPHVAIEGPFTVEDIWLAFQPTVFAEGGRRFKAEDAFLSHDKSVVLISSLVVERGFAKHFFVRISAREEGGVTVGLEKMTRPEISDAVKRVLGLYVWKIMQVEPETRVLSTNIEEFLADPEA